MPDEIPQPPQDQPAAPEPTGPPPAWDEVKKAPEYSQLDPNQQLALFSHWRNAAVQHISSQPGFTPDMLPEFNQAASPEMQRLGDAAAYHDTGQHSALYDHLQNVPTDQQPEGFWGTMGRGFASRIIPAAATAGGALGAGLLATPETVGIGTIPAAVAGGVGAGLGAEELQKQFMGPEWFAQNQKQMEINAKEHPVAHQIGTMIPFLLSAWTGAPEAAAAKGLVSKVVSEESPRIAQALGGAAERVITGGIAGGTRAGVISETEEKGITPGAIVGGAARGAATLGAVSLFPMAKTILGQAIKGVPDSVSMALAGELYDSATEGRPFNFQKVSDETKGNIPAFVLQNALLGFLHGAPLRAKSAEAPPTESKSLPSDAEFTQRLAQLESEGKGDSKEAQDLREFQQTKQPTAPAEAAPPTEAPPLAEAAPPVTAEREDKVDFSGQTAAAPPAELPPEKQALVEQVNKGLAAGEQPPAKIEDLVKQVEAMPTSRWAGYDFTEEEKAAILAREAQEARTPKEVVAPERIAKAEEGRPTAPLEQVSKAKQDSAQKLWAKALDEGREPTIQEWQKAAGKGGPALRDAFSEALKQVYPQHETFSNNTKDIAERLNRGEEVKVPKELEEHLNPNINLKRLPDGTAQVASVDHPDYGNIKNPGDLDRARAPEIAKRRAVQKTAETLPELTPEGKAATEELLSIATEDDIKKTEQFMRSHSYEIRDEGRYIPNPTLNDPSGELYDAIRSRVLRAIHRGDKVDNGKIGFMIPTFHKRGLEGLKTELPTPESGRELGTQPDQFTGEVKPEEVGAAAGTVAPEAPAEAATSPHEQALKDSGITDPKAFLDKVNERMRAAGKPELTMEDIAAMQQRTSGAGTEAATPEVSELAKGEHGGYDPIQKLQNTQKLAELGFYTNKENPIGEVIKNLRESGTPLEKLVANLLHNSGVDFSKVKTTIDDYLNARGRHEGRPNEQDFRISLNPSLPHGDKGIVGTLLHEAYHHVTVWKLQDAYAPNKYEAAAIKQLQGIMEAGRKAAFREVFGRDAVKGEMEKFVGFLEQPNTPESRAWLTSQSLDIFHKLINNHEQYYGLANLKEMAAEITNPAFHNFVSNLPPTPSVGGAFKNLLQQFNNFITRLVAGRPVPQMDRLRSYLEAAATLGVDAPRTRGIAGTELIPTMSSSEMVDKAFQEAGVKKDERSKSPGMYASIMRDSGVPYIGNFLGTHEQMAKDAQDELAKNPNAARERADLLKEHKAGATAEDFHLFRAQLSEYRRQWRDASLKNDTAGMQAAEAKANNWMQEVFNKTAQAGKALQAVQGALDINTGDFFDLKSYYKMVFGKDFTPKQEEQAKQIVQATTEARVETLKNSIQMGQEIAKTAEGTVNELGKAAQGTKLSSVEKKAATAAGVTETKTSDGKSTQLDFGWEFNPADAGKKLSAYLKARFGDKPYKIGQENLTIREVGQIWKFIKANYLDGTQYVRPDELIQSVANDLNVDKRLISEALARPKTVRSFIDARYRAQAQQRAITNTTKAWMEDASKGEVGKWASRAWELPRSLAVIGHVNPSLTHAGSLLFRPSTWSEEIPSIGQAFKSSFLGDPSKGLSAAAFHERLMQDTMASEHYGKFTNLGLAAKVGTLDDIGQYNTFLGKIGVAGNRGMDVLKSLRMQRAEAEYSRIKNKDWFTSLDDKGKDDVLREMMSAINTETGTTTPGFTKTGRLLTGDWRMFLFAPRLEGARWQQMVIDPIRATSLWMKGNSATAGEKYFRSYTTRRLLEQMGTMTAALAANAAVLKAIGSDDKINYKDPTRSDWLAFKVNGQTVIAPSSFLAPLRLSLSVALSHVIPAENRQPYTDKIASYAFGKVTPTITDIAELARAKQGYTGRPLDFLPWAPEQKLDAKQQKDPVSWYEYALTKGPIPLSATVEGWYNAMTEQGSSSELAKTIIGASLASVGSIFAVHQHPTTPEKSVNP